MIYGSQAYSNKTTRIRRLVLIKTGTYQQQWHRPYQSVLDTADVPKVIDAFSDSKSITAGTMAGVANRFIKPAINPEGQVDIAGGWGSQRCRFLLELQHTDQIGLVTNQFVVGYTDHPGVGNNGAIDPRMVFTVNAINITKERPGHNAMGNAPYQQVVDASSVLVNSHYNGMTAPSLMYGLRPEDIYTHIDNLDLRSGLNPADGFVAQRALITTKATKSRRTNAIAPAYVAGVLDSYLQTTRSDLSGGVHDINEAARQSVRSLSASEDLFMNFLLSRGQSESNYMFTYGDLMVLDPNVTNPQITVPVPLSPQLSATLHQAGQSAAWHGSDYETLFAVTLTNALPGYMLTFNLSKLNFTSTNLFGGAQFQTLIKRCHSFATGVDTSSAQASFIYRLENELLKDLTYNNSISYHLDVDVDLLGDTSVAISLNGGPVVRFVTPSFCDSLLSPMTTGLESNLTLIANDFGKFMEVIADGAAGANTDITASGMGLI